jgi:hypothetical protein
VVAAPKAPVEPATGVDRIFASPDVHGPRVLLGLVWFGLLVPAAVFGAPALALLFGAVAAFAARGTALAWRERGFDCDQRVAAVAAGAIAIVAGIHVSLAGVLLGVTPVIALLVAGVTGSQRVQRPPLFATAAATTRCIAAPAIAIIGVMLVARTGLWTMLAFVVLVSAYDAGHFLVGAESRSPVPGILGGIACTVVAGVPLVVSQLPPFDGNPIGLVFAGLVGVVAPLGQIVASLALPAAGYWVGPLRRLDAYIVAGPVFALVAASSLTTVL